MNRISKKKRWSWKVWRAKVAALFPADDVVGQIAAEIAGRKRSRGFWAHDLEIAWGETQGACIQALHRLSRAGLLSRCPVAPLYVPTLEPDPKGADYQPPDAR